MADLLDRIDATVDGLCACGCGDVDPSGRFQVPDYTRLSHGTYQLWCSLSDETKAAALRDARNLAATARCSQEYALAQILATWRD